MTEQQRNDFIKIRKILDGFVEKIVDSPTEINDSLIVIRKWSPGVYSVGDVRLYEGNPYKCSLAHDSTENENWNPISSPALWIQYHGTTIETARPWVQPQGSHDIYKAGEYMIWTDGTIKKCLFDTNYSPDEYPSYWETAK